MNTSAEAQAKEYARMRLEQKQAREGTADAHGSACFLLAKHFKEAGLYEGPILAGRSHEGEIIRYGGDGHVLSFAPNGAGKSVTAIVPNLLTYPGSVVVIDPKGALASITARRRQEMGHRVISFDPFGAVKNIERIGPTGSYNPLDFLDPDSPDLLDNVRLISESLVVGEEQKNKFFSDSARTVCDGFILFIIAYYEREYRTLETLLDVAYASPAQFAEQILPKMQKSDAFGGMLAQLGNQIAGFTGEAGANVLMTLKRSLGFLQSPRIQAVLRPSDIDFRTLKTQPTTVYLTLPAMRLETYGRWLRLKLSIILNQILDERQPQYPVLFVIDEAAALQKLEMIQAGIALFRGYGIKLWLIWQDLSQLQGIYNDRWGTFVANSGMKQFFNVNDYATAEYVSKYMGNETRQVLNASLQPGQPGGAGSIGNVGRPLMTPDEICRLGPDEQLLLFDRLPPVRALKMRYYADPEFSGQFDPDPYRKES